MRRILFLGVLLCASVMLFSCDEAEEIIDDPVVEEPQVNEEPEPEESKEPESESEEGYLLSEVSADNIPEDDVWVMLDESATSEDFEGLAAAIAAISESGDREIELEFPSLKIIPAFIVGTAPTKSDDAVNYDGLVSVTATTATEIEAWAYSYCGGLKSVTLNAATTLGEGAFCGCEALETVSLATNSDALLQSIGSEVFGGVTENIDLTSSSVNYDYVLSNTLTVGNYSEKFKSITLKDEYGSVVEQQQEEEEEEEEEENDDVEEEHKLYSMLADYSANSYPPDSDTWIIADTIAEYADFSGLREAIKALLTSGRKISLDFPNLEAIPDSVFSGSSYDALASVKADVATTIGDYAFCNCNITSIEFPAAESIGLLSFYSCSSLTSIEFLNVTSIGNGAFEECSNLRSVELPKADRIKYRTFYNCTALLYVSSPMAILIDDCVFYACGNLTSIDLSNATTIGPMAFYDCSSLTSIELPKATEIFDLAFGNCSGLISVALPEVTLVGTEAFCDCTSLMLVELPSATRIDALAFYNCTALTSIELPAVTEIFDIAFAYCSNLTSARFPSLTSIHECAFDSCFKLTDLWMATNAGCVLSSSSFDFNAFLCADTDTRLDTANIDLTLGAANVDYVVDGNKLVINNVGRTFKSITLMEN